MVGFFSADRGGYNELMPKDAKVGGFKLTGDRGFQTTIYWGANR